MVLTGPYKCLRYFYITYIMQVQVLGSLSPIESKSVNWINVDGGD